MPRSQRYLTAAIKSGKSGKTRTAFFSCPTLALQMLIERARTETESPSNAKICENILQECQLCVKSLCQKNTLSAVLLAIDLAKQAEVVRRYGELDEEQLRAVNEVTSVRSACVPLALEEAVEALTFMCIKFATNAAVEQTSYNALISFSTDVNSAPTLELLAVLLDVLATQDNSENNWALHASALQCALSYSDGTDRVFHALCEACRDKSTWLLRFLVSTGSLLEACRVAERILKDIDYKKKVCVPYAVLDELILSCDNSIIDDLKIASQQLQKTLRAHFTNLVTV